MEVDARLVNLAARTGAAVVNNDYSVNRIANLEACAFSTLTIGAHRRSSQRGHQVTVIKGARRPGRRLPR